MAAPNSVIIDLTLDDDDDDDHVSKPSTTRSSSPRLAAKQEARHTPALGLFPPPATNPALATQPTLRGNEPPAKRRKTTSSTLSEQQQQLPANASNSDALLVAYLKDTLWPCIDAVIEELLPAYEARRKQKLHFTVYTLVTRNGDFGEEWERSGGRLSAAKEASVQLRIRSLVDELRDQPERLTSPPGGRARRELTSEPSPPVMVPSIEAVPETQRVATNRRPVFRPYKPPEYSSPRVPGSAPNPPTNGNLASTTHLAATPGRSVFRAVAPPKSASKILRPEPSPPTNGIPPPAADLQRGPKRWSAPRPTRPTAGRPQPCLPKKKARQTGAKAKPAPCQSGKAMQLPSQEPGRDVKTRNPWFGLRWRPYLSFDERLEVLGQQALYLPESDVAGLPSVLHVDFSHAEIIYLQRVARHCYGNSFRVTRGVLEDLRHLIKKSRKLKLPDQVVEAHEGGYKIMKESPPFELTTRSAEDVSKFLDDLYHKSLRPGPAQTFTVHQDKSQAVVTQPDRISSLLYAREIIGNRGFGSTRRYVNFTAAFKSSHEDTLEPQIEWTNCAGDIATFSWVSDTQFLCGTTTHSDSHNQQYNKPGNLLLGSSRGTLRAYPDHRILRPLVSHGDNALDSMVQSQDPWLFSSVVDSDYDPHYNLGFTSSFDNTVKIWRIAGETMQAIGTWEHQGRVNFVVVSKHPSGMVATAADVSTDAVRVYHIGRLSLQEWDAYSCTRIHDEVYVPSEKWGYCPAAIRWGLAPNAQHLLLIGYSPRNFSGDERDIPEDKLDTGELCLWDTLKKTQVKINSAAMQNVFEVTWHPSRNMFAVATSKAQTLEKTDHIVKTQIRIFEPNIDGQYASMKVLDCPGVDINELVIQPNSFKYSYVAAGCTDGKVYVWDTAKTETDRPMCTLAHGDPVEEVFGEKELEDIGVKFISWGTTMDRLYTGSSDGVVKVWNIRDAEGVHLRDLIEVPGPITAGAFSPNREKLVIGDGSGRVYLMSLAEMSEDQEIEASSGSRADLLRLQVEGRQRVIRRPKPFIPHPEVPPPGGSVIRTVQLGHERAQGYLERGELVVYPHIGAVQGPNYMNTGLFRTEAHRDDDISQPLLPPYERQQQQNCTFRSSGRVTEVRDVLFTTEEETRHRLNQLDDEERGLAEGSTTRLQLEEERAELDPEYDLDYDFGPDEISSDV